MGYDSDDPISFLRNCRYIMCNTHTFVQCIYLYVFHRFIYWLLIKIQIDLQY